MAKDSKIQWCDATLNPVMGCTPVSEGCDHCYAQAMIRRFAGKRGWPSAPDEVTLFPDRLDLPEKWQCPMRIFVCSMGDLFHPKVPAKYIGLVYEMMAECSWHTFILLTKRPEQMVLLQRDGYMPYLPNV